MHVIKNTTKVPQISTYPVSTEHSQCTALYKKINTVNALLLHWDCMSFPVFLITSLPAHHKFTFDSMMFLKSPQVSPERIETLEIAFCMTQ